MLIMWFPTHMTQILARTRRRTQYTSTYDSGTSEDEKDVGPDKGQKKPFTDVGGTAWLSAAWEQRKQSSKY